MSTIQFNITPLQYSCLNLTIQICITEQWKNQVGPGIEQFLILEVLADVNIYICVFFVLKVTMNRSGQLPGAPPHIRPG